MKHDDPVTVWVTNLRNGEDAAAQQIWEHFAQRLHDVARHQIRADTRRVYDEEDAAISAFNSFCNGVRLNRFPRLDDRQCLWRLLMVITSRKVAERHRFDHRDRRDVRRTITDSVFRTTEGHDRSVVDQALSREPTPEFAAEFAETCEVLFDRLDDPRLVDIASMKMQGLSDDEVATRLCCSRRTVQRKLESIRRKWTKLQSKSSAISGATEH